MKNLIHVIYPDESVHSYVIESDETVERILENVFAEWNHGSDMECDLFKRSKKRSVSVNDIVCVNAKYFQCVSIGWNEVDIAYVNDLENEVSTNKYRDTSAYMALSDVMWQRKKNIKQNLVTA
jgi:hypothetical protein